MEYFVYKMNGEMFIIMTTRYFYYAEIVNDSFSRDDHVLGLGNVRHYPPPTTSVLTFIPPQSRHNVVHSVLPQK